MNSFTIWGIILIGLGTFFVAYGSHISNKKNTQKLLSRITASEGVIKDYDKKQKELINKQVDVYKETLEKVARGEIPLPPDFIKIQEETLISSAKDIEQWAKNLDNLEGMEKDKIEMEFIALDARAAQIDAKLRPSIKPIFDSFKEVILALNKANTFGGKIDFQVFEAKERIVIAHTEHNKPQRPIQEIITIAFPSGKQWVGKLFPLIIGPETPSNFEHGPFIHLYGGNIRVEVYILADGSYRFTPKQPQGWPDNIAGKTGDKQFVVEAIKYVFQKEMMLNQSNENNF